MEKLFYIQDKSRGYVGNSMVWWAINDNGYVCDIRKAKVWKEQDAVKRVKMADDLRMWPKEYIDARIQHHIDMQDCDFSQGISGDKLRDGK